MTMELYEIADDYRAIASMLEDADQNDPAAMEAVSNALEQVGGELSAKALSVVRVITNHDSDVAALDTEIARLMARKKSIAARREWLDGYLLNNMQLSGISEIKCPAFTIRLRENPPSVVVTDDAAIPAKYMRVPPPPMAAPDKAEIKRALLAGLEIPGCKLDRKIRVEIK